MSAIPVWVKGVLLDSALDSPFSARPSTQAHPSTLAPTAFSSAAAVRRLKSGQAQKRRAAGGRDAAGMASHRLGWLDNLRYVCILWRHWHSLELLLLRARSLASLNLSTRRCAPRSANLFSIQLVPHLAHLQLSLCLYGTYVVPASSLLPRPTTSPLYLCEKASPPRVPH